MPATKIGGNTTNILKCYFSNKFTLSHIRLNICISKISFSFLKQYLFGLLFCRNAKKTRIDQIIPLYFVWNETSHKPLKVAAAKKSFPGVYIIDTTCFDKFFLFHVMTGRHYFKNKSIVTHRFSTTAMLLRSLQQVFLKEVSILYP